MNRICWILLCLLSAACCSLELAAQTVDTMDPALRARIDRIAEGVLQQRGVPSASVAVVKGGKLVYTHAYGKAHLDPDVAGTPEMRSSIGRVPEKFRAGGALLLH